MADHVSEQFHQRVAIFSCHRGRVVFAHPPGRNEVVALLSVCLRRSTSGLKERTVGCRTKGGPRTGVNKVTPTRVAR